MHQIWGSTGNGRSGRTASYWRSHDSPIVSGGIGAPVRLDIADVRIVDVSAAGWSFVALDSDACIWGWGQMDGENWDGPQTLPGNPGFVQHFPRRLEAAGAFTMISCGRSHFLALDDAGRCHNFYAWCACG